MYYTRALCLLAALPLAASPLFVENGVYVDLTAGPSYTTVTPDINALALPQKGSSVAFDQKFHPNFIAGARLRLDHDTWDGSLFYTYNTGSTSIQSSGALLPIYNIANAFADPSFTVEQVQGTLDTSWKSLFLEIGKEIGSFYRFHYGLAGTWGGQSLTISYDLEDTVYKMWTLADSWGAGLRSGGSIRFPITSSLFLRGSSAASLLWTRFRGKRKDTRSNILVVNTIESTRKVTAGYDGQFSLVGTYDWGWGKLFIEGSWFFQNWVNQTRFLTLESSQTEGDLTVQGAILSLTVAL